MRVRNNGALTGGLQYSALDLGTVVDDGAVGIVVAGGESGVACHSAGSRASCETRNSSTYDATAVVRGRHDDVRLLHSGGTPALL